MAIETAKKQELVTKFGKTSKDTGNTSVQIAILTEEINKLTDHLKTTKKDLHSKVGIYKKSAARYRLLRYLKETDFAAYTKLIKELKIRNIK